MKKKYNVENSKKSWNGLLFTLLLSPGLQLGQAEAQEMVYPIRPSCYNLRQIYPNKLAHDISSQSTITGVTLSNPMASFLIQGGSTINIGEQISPAENVASSVNRHGGVSGYVTQDTENSLGYILENGVVRYFGASPGNSKLILSHMNDFYEAVGWEEVPNGASQKMALVKKERDGSYSKTILMPNLDAFAADINHKNFVVANIVNTRINGGGTFYPDVTTAIGIDLLNPTFATILTPLSAANVSSTTVYAVNNFDTAVGSLVEVDGGRHAVMWKNGEMYKLGSLTTAHEGYALDINNYGVSVGYDAGVTPGIPYPMSHAFVYVAGRMTDLNNYLCAPAPAGAVLVAATAVNDLGEIVGIGAGTTQPVFSFHLSPRFPSGGGGGGGVRMSSIGPLQEPIQ